MKFSLIHNDKSTIKDELLMLVFIVVWAACGGLLIAFKPVILFLDSAMTTCLGVVFVLLAVMFIPGLIYRFMTNDKKTS